MQEENKATPQSKKINNIIQEQGPTQSYFLATYNHHQPMLPGPPTFSYEPIAMYNPFQNQWRQPPPQQANNTQPEASVANSSHPNQEKQLPAKTVTNGNSIIPSRGRILAITGGNSIEHENNQQRKNYFRRVHSISMEGPYKKTRWSHMPITFSEQDLKLKDYPHMDAMVIEANIEGWTVSKILVDGGSFADIIFTSTLDAMQIYRKVLQRAENPLYGFDGKKNPCNQKDYLASVLWNSQQCKNRTDCVRCSRNALFL